jgi:hypothetical protein
MVGAFLGGVVFGWISALFLSLMWIAKREPPEPPAREPIPRKRPENCAEFYRPRNVA